MKFYPAALGCARATRAGQALRLLRHGERLSGQRRFVDLEIHTLEKPEVGRHPAAGLQQDDVARDDARHRDARNPAVAQTTSDLRLAAFNSAGR